MWNSSLIPVKVLNDYGSGTSWSVAQGILYAAGLLGDPAISEPAHIINMSLGVGTVKPRKMLSRQLIMLELLWWQPVAIATVHYCIQQAILR